MIAFFDLVLIRFLISDFYFLPCSERQNLG